MHDSMRNSLPRRTPSILYNSSDAATLRRPFLHEIAEDMPIPEESEASWEWYKSRVFRTLKITFFIGLLLFVVYLHKRVGIWIQKILGYASELGWGAPLLIFAMTSFTNVSMLPTFPLMIGAGIILPHLYGPVPGQALAIVVTFSGLWLGSMLAFHAGRTFLRGYAEKKRDGLAWMSIISEMIKGEGWWVVFLLRMSPLLPAEVFNYACSLTEITYAGYAAGCCGSIVPVSLWIGVTASVTGGVSEGMDTASIYKQLVKNYWFLGGNAAFFVVIGVVFWFAYQKYKPIQTKVIEPITEIIAAGAHPDQKATLKRRLTLDTLTFGSRPQEAHNEFFRRTARDLPSLDSFLILPKSCDASECSDT
mmetsp:Transcript_42187/g.111516  ORF Transcript_42187/g.111516 Transcript_42187/m.111516 type:complete len:363 (-) Transcript_42187:294-1382(-)